MKRTALLIFLGLLALGGGVWGETRTEFRVGALFGMHFGESKYDLDFDIGGSELVFPLDQKMAGVELGLSSIMDNREHMMVRVRWQTALDDPGGKFTDIDWINTGTFGRLIFSDTRSTVKGSLSDLEVEIAPLVLPGKSINLYFVVGMGYQKIKQRAVDLLGSQLYPSGGEWIAYQVSYDGLALTYEICYVGPQIGLMPRFKLLRSLSGDLRVIISPFLQATDVDDHILRYFRVGSRGRGFGYSGRFTLSFEPSGSSRPRLFGQLVAEFRAGKVEMKGLRRYYADNLDDGYLAGEGFPVATTVTTTQYSVRLHLGLGF